MKSGYSVSDGLLLEGWHCSRVETSHLKVNFLGWGSQLNFHTAWLCNPKHTMAVFGEIHNREVITEECWKD